MSQDQILPKLSKVAVALHIHAAVVYAATAFSDVHNMPLLQTAGRWPQLQQVNFSWVLKLKELEKMQQFHSWHIGSVKTASRFIAVEDLISLS